MPPLQAADPQNPHWNDSILPLQVLFYRSGTKDPGLVGMAEVCRDPYPDSTSWDSKAKGFDPKSTPENPRWWMVDLKASH